MRALRSLVKMSQDAAEDSGPRLWVGFGHITVRVHAENLGGHVVLRQVRQERDAYDLRLLTEQSVLPVAAAHLPPGSVPREVPIDVELPVGAAVFTYLGAEPYDTEGDDGPAALVEHMRALARVPPDCLEPLRLQQEVRARELLGDGVQSESFPNLVAGQVLRVVTAAEAHCPGLMFELGLPIGDVVAKQIRRDVECCRAYPRDALLHGDLHPGNLLAGAAVLDWELALVGDPVYDLAVYLERTRPDEKAETRFVEHWARWVPEAGDGGYAARLAAYRRLDRIRSAYTDVLRTVAEVAGGGRLSAPVAYRAYELGMAELDCRPVSEHEFAKRVRTASRRRRLLLWLRDLCRRPVDEAKKIRELVDLVEGAGPAECAAAPGPGDVADAGHAARTGGGHVGR